MNLVPANDSETYDCERVRKPKATVNSLLLVLTCNSGFPPICNKQLIPSRIWSLRSLRNLPVSVLMSVFWDSVTKTVWARAAQCSGVKPEQNRPQKSQTNPALEHLIGVNHPTLG